MLHLNFRGIRSVIIIVNRYRHGNQSLFTAMQYLLHFNKRTTNKLNDVKNKVHLYWTEVLNNLYEITLL